MDVPAGCHKEKSLEGLRFIGTKHEVMKEFGFSVSQRLMEVEARVLPAPWLLSGGQVQPRDAKWGRGSLQEPSKCGRLRGVGVLVLTENVDHVMQNVFQLRDELARKCVCDLQLNDRVVEIVPWDGSRGPLAANKCSFQTREPLRVVICAMPGSRNDSKAADCRAAIVHTCDIELGVVTFLLRGEVGQGFCPGAKGGKGGKRAGGGKGGKGGKGGDFGLFTNTAYLQNLAIKINCKLGGSHTTWSRDNPPVPRELLEPTLIMGGDCTRPSNGPGVSAVSGNMDQYFTQYIGRFTRQPHGSNQTEILTNLKGMAMEILKEFQQAHGRLPKFIVFLRDGVTEGQMLEVLQKEVQALIDALCELTGARSVKDRLRSNGPRICFAVIRKGHKVHLYNGDKNPEPGTVVDHPDFTDAELVNFNLVSHTGIGRPENQKSVKVPSYVVLYDEIWHDRPDPIAMPLEQIQKMCFALCHLYGYCQMAPSLPAPVVYAHKIAERARLYYQHLEGSDSGSMLSTGGGDGMEDQLLLHRDIRNKMFW
ncbi:hypothetical protein CYMTET_14381 [Cymbomonas tetramitiformis]|uniref:Piwi domain-containing protein n=1 Tax=Cymbomonas tetramitiformis TaxID=36881 RepID=A0AAE0LA30_9CHLO|nr:hypothetical protein CYMTET_14381 [Cymbomonas tetramitiformis]